MKKKDLKELAKGTDEKIHHLKLTIEAYLRIGPDKGVAKQYLDVVEKRRLDDAVDEIVWDMWKILNGTLPLLENVLRRSPGEKVLWQSNAHKSILRYRPKHPLPLPIIDQLEDYIGGEETLRDVTETLICLSSEDDRDLRIFPATCFVRAPSGESFADVRPNHAFVGFQLHIDAHACMALHKWGYVIPMEPKAIAELLTEALAGICKLGGDCGIDMDVGL